jgi:hypothetical protein
MSKLIPVKSPKNQYGFRNDWQWNQFNSYGFDPKLSVANQSNVLAFSNVHRQAILIQQTVSIDIIRPDNYNDTTTYFIGMENMAVAFRVLRGSIQEMDCMLLLAHFYTALQRQEVHGKMEFKLTIGENLCIW